MSTPHWKPDRIKYAPLFNWPPQPFSVFVWLIKYPGYLWPKNLFYVAVTLLIWHFWHPELVRCATLEIGWVSEIMIRNFILMWVFYGGWHLVLYTLRLQGKKNKYNPNWPKPNKAFLWGNQTLDNIFWSCTGGFLTWTVYEVGFWWAYANGYVPALDPQEHPVAFIVIWFFIPFWREFHFYWIHRLIHWKPLYRHIHYLHHKNVNPGPWSGLAMHPIEHVLYFSCVLIHFVVPSPPLHFLFNVQTTALGPAGTHHGFEGPVLKESIHTGSYFHYLHHKHFECNYGDAKIPLDKAFGTFHDGEDPPARAAVKAGQRTR